MKFETVEEMHMYAFWKWYSENVEKITFEEFEETASIETYSFNGLSLVEIYNDQYAIGDNDDADNAASTYIEDTLWAFNADFIAGEIGNLELIPAIRAINEMCEDGNEPMRALIEAFTTIEEFVKDAISADGRGHFISSYDGEENEIVIDVDYGNGDQKETFYIYRIN